MTRFTITVALLTDVGSYRQANEDAGRYVQPHDPDVLARKGVLVIVADGMGGHAAGQVASRLAVEAVHRAYYEDATDPPRALRNAFARANREIYEASRRDGQLQGMGTTCTALALHDGTALCAHVGDSRVYLVRGTGIYTMTEDHSTVQEMVARGLLSRAQARRHAERNVLVRAVGTHPDVEISVWEEPLPVRVEDRFLVCSDGLHSLVEDEEIKAIVLAEPPVAACQRLVTLARRRGGYDNITVAALSIEAPAGDEAPPETRDMKVTP